MQQQKLLDIQNVSPEQRVIIYGAGRMGLRLWKENQNTHRLNIIMFVDKNAEMLSEFPMKVYHPSGIASQEYDWIIISLSQDESGEQVKTELLELGVPRDKIISGIWKTVYLPADLDYVHVIRNCAEEKLSVGLYIKNSALGDQIIALALYDDISKMFSDCYIDIYSVREDYSRCVFEEQECLREIFGHIPDNHDIRQYDLFFEISSQVIIRGIDSRRVKKHSNKLYKKVLEHVDFQKAWYVDGVNGIYAESVLLTRARKRNCNKYTIYNESGLFSVDKRRTRIHCKPGYKEKYESIKLGHAFVTYNYGANKVTAGSKKQAKMWPASYHEKLNQLIKDEFPEIEMIQVGAADCEKIPGADRYVLGEDLEVVKHILSNSILHIDCEGGLVHLATNLGTKCAVMFGPTPIWYLGYDQNINIAPIKCGECMGATPNWFDCYMYDRPECMYSITPEMVFGRIKEYLSGIAREK